jgi:hypothetical protein
MAERLACVWESPSLLKNLPCWLVLAVMPALQE